MIRTIARFVLLEHVTTTIWISGIVALIGVIDWFGGIYPIVGSLFAIDIESYATFSMFFKPVGLLAMAIFFLSVMLNRRRKLVQSGDEPRIIRKRLHE